MANAIRNLFEVNKISRDFSSMMKRLYELHLISDYGRVGERGPTKEELRELLNEVKEFLRIAREVISSS